MAEVVIREATKTDCAAIASMIQELAEYEKLAHQAKIDEQVLIKDGFGDHRYFNAYVAELKDPQDSNAEGPVVGFALYFYIYSTWEGRSSHLEDLYVQPKYRSLGIGKKLFHEVVKTVLARGCTRLQMTVLNWNTPTIAIYRHFGAEDLTEKEGWHVFRMTKPKLEQLVSPSPV